MAEEPKWVDIQKKTFTRWANTFLKERLLKIDDLAEDLSDGVNLINLLEIISSKELGKYNTKPKMRAHKLENTGLALKFLTKEGIKLVNIGNEDIVDGKLKLVLGLIWTIILRYQIHIEEGKSARSDLLKWVRQQIPEYDIQNFTKDWNDGRAICALANSLKPGLCSGHRELNPNNALANAELGIDLAWKELEIPKVLDPRDMVDPEVDELSVMTYISYYRDWLANQGAKKRAEEIERTPVPARCRAYGPGLEKGETFIETYFTIEAINANGRRVPIGGHPFLVNIKSPSSTVPTQMTDNNDGTYTVKYTPTEPGKHIVSITLWDKHISNSPREVPVVRSGADAKYCKVFGPGVESGVVFELAQFTIQAFNRVGEQLRDGGDPFEVKVVGPYNTNIPAKVVDNKNGTYACSYEPIDPGTHVVNVTLHGQHVDQSPYKVPVAKSNDPRIADALQCRAYGPGLEKATTTDPAVFTIEARNSRGELITGGGVPIDVDVADAKGTEIPVKLVDNKDGTFTATYQPKDAGVHTVDVILRHYRIALYYDHIQQSPFKVEVEAGADPYLSYAYGPGLQDGIPNTLPTTFTIQAMSSSGQPMTHGGDNFVVSIHDSDGTVVPHTMQDNDDGTYTVDYEPVVAQRHRIDIKLKNINIKDAPFYVNVREGASPQYSLITGFTFTIQAKSKNNQPITDGLDNFAVLISGPSGTSTPTVVNHQNGTYTVQYSLTDPGQHTITVKLNNQNIKGSPVLQSMSNL